MRRSLNSKSVHAGGNIIAAPLVKKLIGKLGIEMKASMPRSKRRRTRETKKSLHVHEVATVDPKILVPVPGYM